MTTKITPEAVKERIATLESAGELSLKEQFYLEALRLLVAGMDSEPVIIVGDDGGDALAYRRLIQSFAPGTKLYRHAQPAPVAYSDFEEFWSAYIHPLAQDDELKGFAWDIWCAAMLQAGNSPVIPDDWTGNDKANAALMMLDRIETVDPVDDDRIDGIKRIVRELAAATQPQNAPQNIPEIIPDSCTWTFSNYDDHWSGTCGVEWIFPDGGPEENGVKFCPKCGKSVAVSATEGTEE